MKRILFALICILFVYNVANAELYEKIDETTRSICPKTLMSSQCMTCHVSPDWSIKDGDPHRKYNYPNYDFNFIFDKKGKPVKGFLLFRDVNSASIVQAINYCQRYDVKHLVIEIFSFGGSLAEAWRAIGVMHHWESQGAIIETRCHGIALSAGFLISASGTKGYRYVSPRAEFMWHELWTIKWISIETPSDKEDEAAVLRHWQDNVNEYLAGISNLTKEELDALIYKREMWVNGRGMVEYGFADKLLGD